MCTRRASANVGETMQFRFPKPVTWSRLFGSEPVQRLRDRLLVRRRPATERTGELAVIYHPGVLPSAAAMRDSSRCGSARPRPGRPRVQIRGPDQDLSRITD
jgi:hypothetical protein